MASIQIGNLRIDGHSVSIRNNVVYVDGKRVEGDLAIVDHTLDIRVLEGTLGDLSADGNVSVTGDVRGNVASGGNTACDCVGGNVSAGGNVRCGRIGGHASAGGNIRHA